ncbi:hypothetical protein TTHERM_00837860 (macronuclear) [Tetrahymena thermophila SB210]|uniref:Uncharacterized protein n=1 Tax=Tetrahymena thermophila (strain SB210) TaxID=312017 RepID=I7MMK1_TETTS|nr:hypothetical protein TTHERM_00837860 [Tetrahymena thermophila SB210]EAS05015.2 hypothetical protein TTHERM_00837860 [Tetrahymena thermophila SB210]|eukprot:XP_001025260.2 hypothetical protein TTHERM_00837860 [Tetrahymena thermophila SB210]
MRSQAKQIQIKSQHFETEDHQQNFKKDQIKANDLQNQQNEVQKEHFITEIPIETQRQLDRLKEKHRKRMQEEREMYKQSQQQIEVDEYQKENPMKSEQKVSQIPQKYSNHDNLRQESINSIEYGKQRRQKMILVNLNKLQNKLNQDAQKIDETIDLLRIEIVETQKEIKEKAKIEREEMQEYHNSMHKQIADLLKMKHNILHNQQQIQISQIKQKPKREKRSISESQLKKHNSSYQNNDLFQKMNLVEQNSGFKEQKNVHNFNSFQKSEQMISNISDQNNEDESLFYSEERNPFNQDANQYYSQDQYTFNQKPLYVKMEEKYQSSVVLPEIQQRNDVIKQRSEFYRKRMDPIKLFKDHEKMYEGVKEEKEQQRAEKIFKNQQEIRQYSQERYTQSQTYVKVLNEEHQKKENQKKKEIMQKVLLQKQRNYFPSISDSSRMKRSQSSSEISQSINLHYNDYSNKKQSQINYISSNNHEQLTEKEKKLMRIDNHKEDLANKEKVFKTNEGSIDQSLSEIMLALNSDKQTSIEQQINKRSKRKILTQKFHGEHSPLPEVFVTDDLYSSEKKKISKENQSQDLIQIRREPQITTSAFDINVEQKQEVSHQNQNINKTKQEQNAKEQKNDNSQLIDSKDTNINQTSSRSSNAIKSSPIKIQKHKDHQEQRNDFNLNNNNEQTSLSNNRTKTPNIQVPNNKNIITEQKQQKNEKIKNSFDNLEVQKSENNFIQNNKNIVIEQTKLNISHQKDLESFQNQGAVTNKPQISDKKNQNIDQNQKSQNIPSATAHFQQEVKEANKNVKQNQITQNQKQLNSKTDQKDDKEHQDPQKLNYKQQQPRQNAHLDMKRIEKQEENQKKQTEKNKNIPEIQIFEEIQDRSDEQNLQISKRKKRSPENIIKSKARSQQNLKSQNNVNLKSENVQQSQQQLQENEQIQQLYKQFKQIKNKSGRSASEITHNQNDELQSSKLDQLNQKKYKDYMKDVKQKYKLERQIDDWKKIDESELLNDQQKIIKISKKVQYLDTKLQQMRDLAKQNKRNQLFSQSEQQDEDAILINSVQAKIAILNKLN